MATTIVTLKILRDWDNVTEQSKSDMLDLLESDLGVSGYPNRFHTIVENRR
jgi:hypothetical protein